MPELEGTVRELHASLAEAGSTIERIRGDRTELRVSYLSCPALGKHQLCSSITLQMASAPFFLKAACAAVAS